MTELEREQEQELFLTWQAKVDSMGPFADIDKMQQVLLMAPDIAKQTAVYYWLRGFIDARIMC